MSLVSSQGDGWTGQAEAGRCVLAGDEEMKVERKVHGPADL